MMQMMTGAMRPYVEETEALQEKIGQRATLRGMVYRVRRMSGFSFVVLRTARHLAQCVVGEHVEPEPLREGMAVALTGLVRAEPRSRSGWELNAETVAVLSRPEGEPPVVVSGKELRVSLETMLDYRPITLRNARQRAIFKLQEGLCRGVRAFLTGQGFTEIHSPKLTCAGAEGGANVFALDYFGRQAFLAQSPQFYKQMMVGVLERVFEIAPVFRAEKHDTARHLNEYTSIDLEMGFIHSFAEVMELETAMLRQVMELLRAEYQPELELLEVELPQIGAIPGIPFAQAKEWVSREFHRPITDEEDFEPEEEKLLGQLVERETGSQFLFVTHYRSSKRPFYAMDTPENPEVTESFDLLFRGLEVTTGGQRIHDYGQQVEKMIRRGMDPAGFESYLMAHRAGLPPHGGLGLGLERLCAQLLRLPNVRYAMLFPRDTHRLEP